MIQEALVILACTQNKGCVPATSLYYDNNPKVEYTIKRNERLILRQLAPEVITVAPYALILATGRANFRLSNKFLLHLDRDQKVLFFRLTF